MEIRKASAPQDIARAVTLDDTHSASGGRADHIAAVAQAGGLSVAVTRDEVQAFCCLDFGYFFEKPFISLLFVAPDARRLGLGTALLTQCSDIHPQVWTSTNRSNAAMRRLLEKAGWHYCGELIGLDEGDPERFYRTA